ncbi:hypothetical protein BKA56DRAFT_285865 [Ilyonectria sp. MPI-CAGE-AT-0026]|nr:hypothetical protein BKA56DRAFT_285865 [Ilyonectria sp. MPI-CAGE-AT-0026]
MCGRVLLCTTGVLSQAIVFLVVGGMSSQCDAAIVFGPGIVLFFCPLLHQSPMLTAVYSPRAASVGGLCTRIRHEASDERESDGARNDGWIQQSALPRRELCSRLTRLDLKPWTRALEERCFGTVGHVLPSAKGQGGAGPGVEWLGWEGSGEDPGVCIY